MFTEWLRTVAKAGRSPTTGRARWARCQCREHHEHVVDLTVVAIPGYFGSMGAEYAYTKRRIEAGDDSMLGYERKDTWYFFNIVGLVVGMGLGLLIKRWTTHPNQTSAGSH